MAETLKKMKSWVGENLIVLLYFLFAVVLEVTAVFVVEGTPFLSRPFLSLGLLFFVCGIVLIVKNNYARTIICGVMLLLQMILDIVFEVIFAFTDQYFDLGMLSLRNDAFAILENLPVSYVIFYVGLALTIFLVVYGLRRSYREAKNIEPKHSVFFYAGLSLAGLATLFISFFTYFPLEAKNKYDEMKEGRSATAYSAYGMIGNLLGEAGKAAFQKNTPVHESVIDDFIYEKVSTPTEYFGIAKDKNVVVILAESLEWYTFLRGNTAYSGNLEGEYPNALDIPQEVLDELYPNLTYYYRNSVVMTNFHSREKTDISETLSIMGAYPTGAYVNYDYPENTIPYTLPNIVKAQETGNMCARSFHNGFKSFYNRQEAHAALGFEKVNGLLSPVDMYDMEKMSDEREKEGYPSTFTEYMDNGERNLDSEMVETAKDLMFPTDQRFYTQITTLTMHGMYYDRVNMRKENNTKLAEKLTLLEQYKPLDPEMENFDNAELLYYYMTTGLEFDYMLGCMRADLEEKELLDDTVIVLFADHNAYYQGMSGYVKDIADYDTENKFTDLYNVPFMIWDKDLVKEIQSRGQARVIDKFTVTADIVPTLMDLLGIRYYENLYYGHSVFSPTTSVLYSRAYDIFIGEGLVRRSVKGEFYRYQGTLENGKQITKGAIEEFEKEGDLLVEKIKYCDFIFRQDHFGNKENYQRFQEKMQELNS